MIFFLLCTFVCIGTSLVIFEWCCPRGMFVLHGTFGPSAGIASALTGPDPCLCMLSAAT